MHAGKQPWDEDELKWQLRTSGCTAEKPQSCVYPEEGGHTLPMFSQCQDCNISTFLMEMHWGSCSSLKRGIWGQSHIADKHPAYLQITFWHICLDVQMSRREVPFLWMKCVQSAELFHSQLQIQVIPWTLIWGGQEMSNFLTYLWKYLIHVQLKEKGILAME